jgi:hypothetical protein
LDEYFPLLLSIQTLSRCTQQQELTLYGTVDLNRYNKSKPIFFNNENESITATSYYSVWFDLIGWVPIVLPS